MVGGRIDPGTTLLENLAREIYEEAGLTLAGEPRLSRPRTFSACRAGTSFGSRTSARADGEPRLSDEHDAYRWFDLGEIRLPLSTDPYLKELMEGNIIHNIVNEREKK